MAPIDILRRGGVEVKTVSITGSEYVESAHGVTVKADLKFEDAANFDDADIMLLPGGMPGASNLNNRECDKRSWRSTSVANASAPSVRVRWCLAHSACSKASKLRVIRASKSTSPVPPTRQSWFKKMATSSPAKARQPSSPTPIASSVILPAKKNRPPYRRICSTPNLWVNKQNGVRMQLA